MNAIKANLKISKLRSDVNSIHKLHSRSRVFIIIVLIQLFLNFKFQCLQYISLQCHFLFYFMQVQLQTWQKKW